MPSLLEACPAPPTHVLVVDDSAVVRQALLRSLTSPDLTVDVAADPLIAIDKMRHARPDVIVLDLEMPRMDGLTFLRRIMSEDPIPVVICSSLAGPGTEASLRALEEGAVDIVLKPQMGVKGYLEESAPALRQRIRGAALARVRRRITPLAAAPAVDRPRAAPEQASEHVIAIGASTGGTEALRALLAELPADSPGLVIVQHMPELFTAAFAHRLDVACTIRVREAQHGDWLLRGQALIAPGNRHLRLLRSGSRYRVTLSSEPPVRYSRPSVDVLFESVARAAGPSAIGVILTGMGSDGADGLAAMKAAGARTLAQDEATCVVFGMPKEAIARGVVDEIVPLPLLSSAILSAAHPSRRAAPAR